MLLSLNSDHKEHLSLLTKQPVEVLVDFCKLAINLIQSGPEIKLYKAAAQKLEVELTVIQNCVYGLVNLLLQFCKYNLNESDFRDSVLTIGFSSEQQVILNKFYQSKKKEIIEILEKLEVNDVHYNNLEWRFEVEVSSRSLLHRADPIVAMNLNLKRPHNTDGFPTVDSIFLQTDPTNLVHIAKELENCLQQSRSRHFRRIQKGLCNNNN
ncbi:COMM domain-containing protein 2 [Agrilus planipennis]|uniref:COMM domain-containing protein 2 n=1 Tax=Agrilus planipennis TaxID=224129 RepID=A0A1W4WHM6_AGRPL|nr:COMM domain-containing protein 2 [Agrilus planipennis]